MPQHIALSYQRIALLALTFLVVIATLLLTAPQSAHAADQVAATYDQKRLTYYTGARYECDGWSGGSDGQGHIYMPCHDYIYELNNEGTLLSYVKMPAGYQHGRIRDVTADNDGSAIYVSVGRPLDNIPKNDARYTNWGKILKFNRTANGWQVDNGFAAGPFPIGNTLWGARNVDVDHKGHLFVTVNALVLELNSANGREIGRFGGGAQTNGAGGAWQAGFDVPEGIAVSPNGNSMYLVEQRFNLVQRWVRTNGRWNRDTNFLIGTPGQASTCAANDVYRLASPYDVATDTSGNLYVLDTTCRRILKYRAGTGKYVSTIWRNYPTDNGFMLYHGFAVNNHGTVVVPQSTRHFSLKDPDVGNQGCDPDGGAPRITRVVAAQTTYTRRITVGVAATDTCSNVRLVRVRGSISTGGAWKSYKGGTRRVPVTLTAGNGQKVLYVSARDANGNVATRTVRVTLKAPPPLIARRTIRMAGGSSICGSRNPLASVASSHLYRVADRCALFSGRVMAIRKAGASTQIRVLIPTHVARRMYANVYRPVSIWVVVGRSTDIGRPIRVGRGIGITAALITDLKRRAVYAIPVYRASGQ